MDPIHVKLGIGYSGEVVISVEIATINSSTQNPSDHLNFGYTTGGGGGAGHGLSLVPEVGSEGKEEIHNSKYLFSLAAQCELL